MGVLDFLNNPSTQQSRGLLNPMMTAPVVEPRGGISGWLEGMRGPGNTVERLNTFGMTLQDISDGGNRAATAATNRAATQEAARKAEALRKLQQYLSPQSGPATGAVNPNAPLGAAGPSTSIPSLRDAAPALMAAQGAGISIEPYVSLLDKAGPDIAYEQGYRYDRRDPASAPAYAVDLGEGQMPVISNGVVQSVQNTPNYVAARAETERAVNDARNASDASYAGVRAQAVAEGQGRGSAPFDVVTVQGPDGRPITTTRQNILGSGPIYGQSDAGRTLDVGRATTQVETERTQSDQARTDQGNIPVLQEALRLLPDVITGLGANQRLLAAQGLAAMGNEEARRQVAATQTFQATTGKAVLAIARQLGSGSGITNADREFAQKIAGGDIQLDSGAISRILRMEQEAIARRAQQRGGGQPQAQGGGITREAAIAEARRRNLIP